MMSFERFNIKLVYEYNSTSFNLAKSYCGVILGSFECSMGTFWFLLWNNNSNMWFERWSSIGLIVREGSKFLGLDFVITG